MDVPDDQALYALGDFLEHRNESVARQWLKLIRRERGLQDSGLSTEQLLNHLPGIYAGICDLLRTPESLDEVATIESLARTHGHFRWMQGFLLDDMFRELDLFQRCIQQAAREFFLTGPISRRHAQPHAHQAIQDLFSSVMQAAIQQLLEEQNKRITESLAARDHALAAQRESEERLRVAAASAGLGIFEWDLIARCAVWENRRMYAIIGQRPEDGPLGADEFKQTVVHPDDLSALTSLFERSLGRESELHTTFRIFRKDDRALRILEMCGSFRYSEDGAPVCFVGTLADITERRKTENELREADRRKDVFLATLAHELRNPLAPIRNGARLLALSQSGLEPHLRSIPGMIERQSEHLSHLIDDLLDLSRITTGKIRLKKEVFDLRDAVVHAMESNQEMSLAREHQLQVNLPTRPVFVDGDRTRLTQVVSNLLDNANKYTPDGGTIAINIRLATERVFLSVEDNGVGIASAELPSVFDLFVQADPREGLAREGLGIGLSMVQSLAHMHGGAVSAASGGLGKGSRFTVALPLSPAPAPANLDVSTAAPTRPKDWTRVLIVDDNRDAADSLAMILDLEGYQVVTAADGLTALEVAARWRPQIAILDIGMPGMNGYELAQALKTLPETENCALIALTGFGAPEDIAHAEAAGFRSHLVKPADLDKLLSALQFGLL